MKILILGAASNIHIIRWVNALSQRGHIIHLITNRNHFGSVDQIDERVIIHVLKFSGNFGYYLNALQTAFLYRKVNPEIVNAHYASGYGTLARLSKLKPLVLSVWGSDVYDFPNQGWLQKHILLKNLNSADRIASTSFSMGEHVKSLACKITDVTITPFGVDTEMFSPKLDGKDAKRFVFGVVKTLMEKYGIEYIIRSFKLFLESVGNDDSDIDYELKIYGRGPLESKLKRLCCELNIQRKVSFEGYIKNSEVPRALNMMDVFCLGSTLDSESFGVAAVEAMACELPVIATDVSGFKEVVLDGETGFIVPRKDENAIFQKMLLLAKDDKLRKEMGVKGRKRVLEFYSWHENVNTMLDLYESVINI